MTRPALIIGLGGTGQWVLTYLKKDLIESNGQVPDTVRLLCFDTLPQAGTEIAAAGGRRGEQEIKVGSVQLVKGSEFVHLGGDVYELSQAISQDSQKNIGDQQLPHLASWFQASYWLANLPRAVFNLERGAGMLRQFGRLALFKDLSAAISSEIWSRLDNAIGQLSYMRKEGEKELEIIIVGSFAGGTGSGLFLDIALLARHRAGKVPTNIRGFFVLPRAFDPDADEDMLARSFAAWRELNRFMVVNKDFTLPSLVYNTKDTALQIREVNTKAFDTCYLVDGVRNGARVAAESEFGVHPTIADTISTILDDKAGRAYTEYAANVALYYATHPGVPMYSVIGTHSYKVPVYYAQQDFSRKFTVNWLHKLVKPIFDKETGKVEGVDRTSPYDPSIVGREEALSVLTAPQEYSGKSEVPTLFFNRIADILREGGDSNPAIVEQYARGSWGGKAWLEVFTNLADRKDIVDVVTRVRQEAMLRIDTVIKPSKALKEPTREFPRRAANNITPFVNERYGFRTATGEENKGKFGAALDECGQAHVNIFYRLMQYWLLRSLNSGNKSGRIGYAEDLLDGLKDKLDDFLKFMDKVKSKRQEVQPYLKAQEARERAKATMMNYAGKKWPSILPLWDDPRAHSTQTSYLKAEQVVIDVRKDELLHASIIKAAREMQKHCVTIQNEIGRWIKLLATGDTGIEGLYSKLERQRREIEKTRQADERLSAVQTRLGDLVYPEEKSTEEIQLLMEGIQWHTEVSPSGFKLNLSIEPTDLQPTRIELPSGGEAAEVREELTRRNLNSMQSYALQSFSKLPEETRVAERLRQRFTADNFVTEMSGKAEPLFDKQQDQQGEGARWSELIRLSVEGVDPVTREYILGRTDSEGKIVVPGLLHELRKKRGLALNQRDQDRLVDIVGSADLHKCTIVRTNDLLPVELFRAWQDCLNAYVNNKKMPPQLNHNFPAEVNAARYEQKVSQKWHRQYRVFHPWVVMLMEQITRLEQFFLCWALKWMRIENDNLFYWYELNMPGFDRPFMLTPKSQTDCSPFQAARFFVLEGLDQTQDSAWALDYNEIQRILENEERSRGADKWVAFLKEQTLKVVEERSWGAEKWVAFFKEQALKVEGVYQIDEHLVHQGLRYHSWELDTLRKKAAALPIGEPVDYSQAYADLADVAAMMFEDRQERKETQIGRQSRNR